MEILMEHNFVGIDSFLAETSKEKRKGLSHGFQLEIHKKKRV